jgi:DNA-binding IclR family transcriptional regulator
MARSSPGVRRVAAILNFIADHPGQSFTLTDLVKALKLSRATCLALLTGLVEVGYLYRASDKNYVLGPALASIGRIASHHGSPLQVAQPEMRALADEFDVICAAFFRERDEIILRDRASSVSNVGWSIPVGRRLTLTPAFGSIFHAWLPEAEIAAWLDSYQPALPAERRASVVAGMAFLREHGFQANVRNPSAIDTERAHDHPFGEAALLFPTLQLSSVEPATLYSLDAILSPVFELRGQIAFALGLVGFTRAMSGEEIARMGARLTEACDRVSTFITGRPRNEAATAR